MRNHQFGMPPLASLAGGHERGRVRSRSARSIETSSRLDTPLSDDDRQVDASFAGIDSELIRSKPLVAAIAREICEIQGGNAVLNWLEAEILLENALNDHPHQLRQRQASQ